VQIAKKSGMIKAIGNRSKAIYIHTLKQNSAIAFALSVQKSFIPIWIFMMKMKFKDNYPKAGFFRSR
jgi:hypothetical protein